MARNGYRILDSDLHIMEPPDLWQRYTEEKFKHEAPIGLNEVVRDLRCVHPDGRLWGMPPVRANALGNGKTFKRDVGRYQGYHDRGWTSQVQLEAMDIEGIDVATIYPTRGLHTLAEAHMPPPLAAALARAYNNWLYDFCQADPRRLIGVGMISPFDIDDAVAEARRCMTDLGFRGVFLRANIVNDRNWHDPYYDPLWATLVEYDVPIGFHESASSAVRQVGMQFEPDFLLRHTYSHPVEQMMALGSFTAGGVCERHPRLRAAFLEGNCSWLPWLLWRLDEHWEMFADVWSPNTTMKPSGYFKRQCWVSVDCEESPLKYAIDYLGKSDNIIFSTDFPHVDAQFPHSSDEFLKLPISDEDKRKILWDNCATFYGAAVAV
jgi:predicted TIM-barrel fold metal-dependent hydrolase